MTRLYKQLIILTIVALLLGACGARSSPTSAPIATTLATDHPTIAPTSAAAQPTESNVTTGLEGLDFDSFVEASYRQLLIRDPETVLVLGLSGVFGVPTDQLTDISDGYIRETQALEESILNQLQRYNRSSLTSEEQLTYDIYAWYLADRVEGHEFMYNDYPVNPSVLSMHYGLLQFFTDLRPVTNLQEAQDYISCLGQVDTKFTQLVDGLKLREENGVMLPRFLVGWILGDMRDIAASNPRSTPYFAAFETKVNALSNISGADKQALLASAEEAVKESVIPAYQALVDYFTHLQTVASNDAGVWKFPNGKEYYAYVLKHYTSTDLTGDQIHALGLQELDRIHAEMRVIFDQLGYPQDESLPDLYARVADDSGTLTGDAIVKGYEDIIIDIDSSIGSVFDLRPSIGVVVMGVPIGGYYTAPAVDGSRPGLFYASNTGVQPKFNMPTLAYHEAIPGHHFQLAIAQQLELPSFRKGADFTAFVEGWALYAERLVAEQGIYANDPYGDLGRLQYEAFRAARLVVDTGIHTQKWNFDQAVEFMIENTGLSEYMVQGEVSRYISLPGQATAYYIGYSKILELRQQAMDELGDQFDLKEFHNLLLGSGAMPLDILEQVVDGYIQTKLSGG